MDINLISGVNLILCSTPIINIWRLFMKKLSMVLAVLMIAASFCIPTAAVQKVDVAALLKTADCYINFDDGIVDVNGNYEVVSVGDTTLVDGVIGKAAKTIGDKNHISIPEMKFADDSFTVTAWVKTISQSSDPCLFGNKSWNSGSNVGWLLCVRGDNMRFNACSNAAGDTRTDTSYTYTKRGEWTHVAIVVDADALTYSVYFDGRLQGTTSYEYYPKIGNWSTNNPKLAFNIGEDGTGSYNDDCNFNVDFDEVAIFKSVLSDREIRAISNYGEPEAIDPIEAFLNTADLRITFEGGEIKDANGKYEVLTVGNVDLVEGANGEYAANTKDGGNYISIPEMKFGTSSFTFASWVKVNNRPTSDPCLFANKSWDNGKNTGWLLSLRENDLRFNASSDSGGATRVDSNYAYAGSGEWVHMALVVDAEAGTYTFYLNGKQFGEVGKYEYAAKIGQWDPTTKGWCFNIGEDGTGAYNGGCNFNVDYDDIVVFKSVLSADQVKAIADYTTDAEEVEDTSMTPAFAWALKNGILNRRLPIDNRPQGPILPVLPK